MDSDKQMISFISKLFDLADVDHDGYLNMNEFV